jgi:drug/metabolite transporter (DMT)-like permease
VLGIVLALTSSVCWGVADFLGGTQARRVPLLRVLLVSQTVGLLGVTLLVAVRGTGAPDMVRLLPAAGGGLAGMLALTGFYRALAIGTMSIVAPISATGVAVPVIVGLAQGDRPAALQLVGIVAASVGVVLASRERGPGVQQPRGSTRASIALALMAAVGFGSFFVGMRASARFDVPWALFAARAAGVGALVVAAAVRGAAGGLVNRPLWPLAVMGLLDLAANAFYALATRHGLLSVVAVLGSLYPAVTVLLARAVLHERVTRSQELGVLATLAGVVAISAA